VEAELVLFGAGMRPNDELAAAAGLDCDRGVHVDTGCRSSDPDIYAAGDVAVLRHPRVLAGLRMESWQNAQDQGVAAARAMLGEPVVYAPVPLVWSEQYGHMVQIAGIPQLACRCLRRETAASGVVYVGLDASETVVAAVGIDAGRDFRGARKWVEQGACMAADAAAGQGWREAGDAASAPAGFMECIDIDTAGARPGRDREGVA
jgi:3-phenylpropionate/trans-cinnamate dioxygenase ferredoxin reductase subunit